MANPKGTPKKLVGGHKVHLYLDDATIDAAKCMGGPKKIASAGIRDAFKELELLRRGEYICHRCGIRKDGKIEEAKF